MARKEENILLPIDTPNIVFNQGFIEVIRKSTPQSIEYEQIKKEQVKVAKQKSKLVITAGEKDVNFTLNISQLQDMQLMVSSGAILAKAVPSKLSKNLTKIGAIELRIKKEEVGTVYMKVGTGAIVTDNPHVKLTRLNSGGYEGFFQGDLKGQKTELIVEMGAILLKID